MNFTHWSSNSDIFLQLLPTEKSYSTLPVMPLAPLVWRQEADRPVSCLSSSEPPGSRKGPCAFSIVLPYILKGHTSLRHVRILFFLFQKCWFLGKTKNRKWRNCVKFKAFKGNLASSAPHAATRSKLIQQSRQRPLQHQDQRTYYA